MTCKNCDTPQRTDFKYCPNCGGKVIHDRLTFKNLWYDFTERYFNLDNTFIKTFLHLFSKPEVVIDGYISGVRRRYLNPASYLGISIALSGILFFIIKKYYMDKLDLDIFDTGLNPELSNKLLAATFDLSTFIFILYIPVIAFAGWATFNKRKYLLPEYIVVSLYTLAHYSISLFPVSLILLVGLPEKYITLSPFFLLLMAVYSIYVVQRLSRFLAMKGILRALGFLMIFLMGYIGISIFTYIILFITGDLSLQDFIPKKS